MNGVQISWKDVVVGTKAGKKTESKQILHGIDGYTKPGTLLAIMGSSGAGKTTFMNTLARRNLAGLEVEGEINLNGIPSSPENMQKLSGYIQQEDVFVAAMTVKEHLIFHARLRVARLSRKDMMERVNRLVRMMGLGHCIHTLIGKAGLTKTLSGGEMKRLSIATEMLGNPPILFADEPTSGLDSFLAQAVIKSLKDLASSGTTVICTIHQPNSDIFHLFENVMLLSMGCCAFMGPLDEANIFFESLGYPCKENFNPADHFITELSIKDGSEDICREKILKICETHLSGGSMSRIKDNRIYAKEGIKDEIINMKLQEYDDNRCGFFKSFWWILMRAFISQYRDKITSVIVICQNVFVASLSGLIYLRVPWNVNDAPYTNIDRDNISGALFLFTASMSFSNMFSVLLVFPTWKKIFHREYYSGLYPLISAFMAVVIAGIPNLIMIPMIFITVSYFMIGFYPSALIFFHQYFTLGLISFCASGYGFFISSIAPSEEAATALASPMMVPLMIFGGFFIKTLSTPLYFIWIKYLSWFFYGFNNLIINQWENVGFCVPTGIELLQTEGCLPANMTDCSCLVNTEKNYRQDNNVGATGMQHKYVEPAKLFKEFGFKTADYWPNVACMMALGCFFRLVSYLVLVYKYRSANR